jgi:sugar-specific transcriptional regulator TrmB
MTRFLGKLMATSPSATSAAQFRERRLAPNARIRNSARSKIDLLGYTLHVWTRSENFEGDLLALVRTGVAVRVVIMDETNPNLASLVNVSQIAATSIDAVKAEIAVSKANFESIATRVAGQGQNLPFICGQKNNCRKYPLGMARRRARASWSG